MNKHKLINDLSQDEIEYSLILDNLMSSSDEEDKVEVKFNLMYNDASVASQQFNQLEKTLGTIPVLLEQLLSSHFSNDSKDMFARKLGKFILDLPTFDNENPFYRSFLQEVKMKMVNVEPQNLMRSNHKDIKVSIELLKNEPLTQYFSIELIKDMSERSMEIENKKTRNVKTIAMA